MGLGLVMTTLRGLFLTAIHPEVLDVLDHLEVLTKHESLPHDVRLHLSRALAEVHDARYKLDDAIAEQEGA